MEKRVKKTTKDFSLTDGCHRRKVLEEHCLVLRTGF
jgi:hypothetical protein